MRKFCIPAAACGGEKGKRMDSRRKGKEGELELAGILRAHGYECRRGQQYCGGNGDADVVGLPAIHIECKRVERLDIDAALAQAKRDARSGELPAVFHRRNRTAWKVTLGLEDFLRLYEAAGKLQLYRAGCAEP